MDITELQEIYYEDVLGRKRGRDIFSNEEKERASLIVEQLEGLTIKEAQSLLERISQALPKVVTIPLRDQELPEEV